MRREIPVSTRRGSVELREGTERRSASLKALHRAIWPELWAEPELTGSGEPFAAPAEEERRPEPTQGRSSSIPEHGPLVNLEGFEVDLDCHLIDAEGYFVDYAGKRVLKPVLAEPAYDEERPGFAEAPDVLTTRRKPAPPAWRLPTNEEIERELERHRKTRR